MVEERINNTRSLVGRDVWIMVAIFAGLIAVAKLTPVRVLQIPGYLLMVGYDLIQNPFFPGLSGLAFWGLYAIYIYALALLFVNVLHVPRNVRILFEKIRS